MTKGKGERHYDIVEWVDFVRGVLSLGNQADMVVHLVGGCVQCQSIVDVLSGVTEVARQMGRCEAPEQVLRRAEAIFSAERPKPVSRFFRLPVELVYDSFLVPAPAGVRTGQQPGWQAHYRAGVCAVDLRVESDSRSGRATLVGQVSDRSEPDTAMAGLPVQIRSGAKIVAETHSNPFGEFELEYEARGSLSLVIILPARAQFVRVPLRRLASN